MPAKKTGSRAVLSLEPALGWTYMSRDALARAKAQMDEESTGVRDEIGFLTIHQRYSDLFFPGTSVLHTRARYALFVPWLFEDLAEYTGPAARRALQEKERVLAGRLRNQPGEDDPDRRGTIGALRYPKPSSQPPSTVYWNALATWGILRQRQDQRTVSRTQAHRLLTNARSTLDDDGQPLAMFEPPFIPLPSRPANWLEGEISHRLEKVEASFIRDCLSQLRPRYRPELSLLARLAQTGASPPDTMWADEVFAVAQIDRAALTRARQAASLAGIGRAIYDALVEQLVAAKDKEGSSTRHQDHLNDMVIEHGSTASELDIQGLAKDVGGLTPRLEAVIEATRTWILAGSLDPGSLSDVYSAAEARKGAKARLAITPNGHARRLEWGIDKHVLADVLHYRWNQVRRLLSDIADVA